MSKYVKITAFLLIHFACIFSIFAIKHIELLGRKLEDVQTHWNIFPSSVKSLQMPSLYKDNLAYLNSNVIEQNIWVLESYKDLEFSLSSEKLLTDYCEVNNTQIVLKYHANSATGYVEPCSTKYCYLVPSTDNSWSEIKLTIDVATALNSPLRIEGIVMRGGYIMFNEISISFDGTEKADCLTTTSSTTTTTDGTTEETSPDTEGTEDWDSSTTVMTTITTIIPTTTSEDWSDITEETEETETDDPTTPLTTETTTVSTPELTTITSTTTSPNSTTTTIDVRDDIPQDGKWKFDCALGYAHTHQKLRCNGMVVSPEYFNGTEFGFWTKCGTICQITYMVQPGDTLFSSRLFQSKLSSEIVYDEARWKFIDGNGWIDISEDISDIRTISVRLDIVASDAFTFLDKIFINTRL